MKLSAVSSSPAPSTGSPTWELRGIAAAFALGASGVQIGTAYLFTPESLISDLHRDALGHARPRLDPSASDLGGVVLHDATPLSSGKQRHDERQQLYDGTTGLRSARADGSGDPGRSAPVKVALEHT